MLPKELQTAINHMSSDNRRVAEAIVIFYEDYYGRKLVQMESRLKALEDQLAKNSRNSNKPPSPDTFNKPAPKSLRKKTGRKPGGQKGHDGTTLKMVDCPDVQVTYRVEDCEVCKNHLIRTFTGARYFARTRSFVSTAQKQHISILDALKDILGHNQIQLQLVGATE